MKILLVDDDQRILDGFPVYFSQTSALKIIATASNGRHALEWLEHHSCDIILSDIHMPGMGGLELLHEVKRLESPPLFVAMTAFDTDETMLEILARGGDGYVIKGAPPTDVVASLESISDGGLLLDPHCVSRLVKRSVRNHRGLTQVDSSISLDEEEKQILYSISQGFATDRISRDLNYAEITIKRRISNLMKRFRARSRAELIFLAQFKMFNK